MEKGRLQTTEKQPKTPNHIALAGGVLGAFAVVGTLGAQQVIAKPVDVAPLTIAAALSDETLSIMHDYNTSRPRPKEQYGSNEGKIKVEYVGGYIIERKARNGQETGPNQDVSYRILKKIGKECYEVGTYRVSLKRMEFGYIAKIEGKIPDGFNAFTVAVGDRNIKYQVIEKTKLREGRFRIQVMMINSGEFGRVAPNFELKNSEMYQNPIRTEF